jgi:IclR family transcriptional regulator, acetate operon repressor
MAWPRNSSTAPRVQSVARATDILFEVGRSDHGLKATEIAHASGLNVQTTYRLLQTLTCCGLLSRAEHGCYVLGLRVGSLAQAFNRQLSPAERLAPQVRSIASRTGATAYAAGWWLGEIVAFIVVRGTNVIQANDVLQGLSTDGHARASGKLLLAFAPASLRDDYLARHPLRYRTPNTITEMSAFVSQLDRIRAEGYALDREEFSEGLCCFAVGLDGGLSPFALSVSAPTVEFDSKFAEYKEIMLGLAD